MLTCISNSCFLKYEQTNKAQIYISGGEPEEVWEVEIFLSFPTNPLA